MSGYKIILSNGNKILCNQTVFPTVDSFLKKQGQKEGFLTKVEGQYSLNLWINSVIISNTSKRPRVLRNQTANPCG